MKPADLALYRAPVGWRRLVELVWRLEHAFERAKAAGKAEDDTRIRIFFILALFTAGFLSLAAGATKTALISDSGRRSSYAAGLGGARADLVDRQGRLLAVDLIHYGLYLDPREIWDQPEIRRVLGAALPRLNKARLERALKSDRREFLIGGLTPAERDRVHSLGLPGVAFEEEDHRVYPLGPTAAHVIGFADRGGEGLAGAELAFDNAMRRQAGSDEPVALSIDLRVQAALEDELQKAAVKFGALGAVGIVTDVHTGEVLAMASAPDFDPNHVGAATPNALTNRAAASVYEMGSVFKIFTTAMGLDSGTASLTSTFDARSTQAIGNRVIHDFHATNRVLTLPEVFIHSSNVGTAKLALQAGAPNMQKYFRSFGLFAPAKIELAEAARPIVPRRWPADTVASASFGHAVSVTPLNVQAALGAVMNGGYYVPLTLRKVAPGERPQGQRVISETTSRQMLDLMRLNVTSKEGSGGRADAPGLSVGGKTGSAEKAMGGRYVRNKLVSSFAAVFPTDGPMTTKRYAVFIMFDEPRGIPETYGFATGGWNAAPTAGRVIDRIAPFLGVRRAPVAPPVVPGAPVAAAPVETSTGAEL